jgi:hypothetical protein
MAFTVILPPNSTGTSVDTVSGTAGAARQVASIGDAVTPANILKIDAGGSAQVQGEAASGAAVAGNPVLIGGQDGTNAVSVKTLSAANLGTGATAGNGFLAVRPADWAVNNVAGAAAQATISKAAGAAGVKHVATSISGQISTIATAQAAQLVFNLRDGATGAGTVLWSVGISLGTNATWGFYLSGLNIIGSAATAMTLETAAAPVAAAFASVALTGYDVS